MPVKFGNKNMYTKTDIDRIRTGNRNKTVSKMLTHKNVTTTQIYADLVSAKKRETVNRISLK